MNALYEKRKNIILEFMKSDFYVPMKEKEIAVMLEVEPADRLQLSEILRELLLENRIEITKRGKYTLCDGKQFTGIFTANTAGFGFVSVEGTEGDYFISKEDTMNAFHGDTVVIVPLYKKRGDRYEAKIVKIVSHNITEIVGTYRKGRGKGYGFIIPDGKYYQDVFVSSENAGKAHDKDKVVAKLISYGDNGKKPEAVISEVIGKTGTKGVDVTAIVRGFGIPEQFEEELLAEAEKIPDCIASEDCDGREDLRKLLMVTIDGEDAKDLDDAVSLYMEDGLYVLGVHIADVSHYVTEGSKLDKEALSRGCSNYLTDRVIPMLPRRLSNGICSLNANEDRLAMSCIMRIDEHGTVMDYQITPSVINVDERMNYSDVNRMFNNDKALCERYSDVLPMLKQMKCLSDIIRSTRKDNGAIDFDMPESKIILDSEGFPIEIKPYEANDATRLIEDFMLKANETVASYMFWQGLPFLYRVHETPDRDKMMTLKMISAARGVHIKGNLSDIHPGNISSLLEDFKGTPEEAMMTRLTLRSMKQARYSPECLGHFGLALKEYTHFTSPIRRYPDLQIHRILKEQLSGTLTEGRINHYNEILEGVAASSSKLERRANEAERDVEKLFKAMYMEKRIGKEYDAIISGITNFGIYAELSNTCEGLIHISKIPGDYFEYDEKKLILTGEHTGEVYSLGDAVRIRVAEVDTHLKTVDFDLLGHNI